MNEQATKRVTMAQAVIAFLNNQYVERDGREQPFFAGCFGIFGHGNIAGIGQALQQMPEFRYYQARNEQAMVHIAAAYAKTKNRLQTFACTSSIGPGGYLGQRLLQAGQPLLGPHLTPRAIADRAP